MTRLYAPNDSHSFNQGGIQFINGVGVSNDVNVVAGMVAKGYVQKTGAALTVYDRMTEADLQALIDELGLVRVGLDEKYELIALLESYVPDVDTVKCATPVAAPVAGAVVLGSTVVLTCATPGADIYYTLDGAAPDATKTKYTVPVAIASALTLKAIAIKDEHINSEILSAAYTQAKVATPVAAPAAGEVADNSEVALSCATAGAKIYYTVDGSEPDATDTEYTAPIVITDPVTIKAIGILAGCTNSDVLAAAYTIAA